MSPSPQHARPRSSGGDVLAPGGPNLARRPFTNQRPVKRISLLLLVLGLALLLVDVWLYSSYVSTRRATATELTEIEAAIVEERRAMNAAADRLQSAEVERQNELVRFMNQRIAERTFGWSVLFDRLALLLPDDVRLVNLAPSFEESEERRLPGLQRAADETLPSRQVNLGITALARDGEAILEFIDALFADPAFERPNLSRETTSNTGEVQFQLSVTYLPAAAAALASQDEASEALADGEVRLDDGGEVEAEREAAGRAARQGGAS